MSKAASSRMRSWAGRLIALAACAALVVAGSFPLVGCSSIQTNDEMDDTLTTTLDSSATISAGVLTVGVNSSNTPYAGMNSSDELIGFDIDVAAAIADELGLELNIVDVNSNGRSALANGQVDVVLGVTKSGNDDTVTYSEAYLYDGPSLFMLADNAIESIDDFELGEDKVIVQAETNSAVSVQEALGIDNMDTTSTMQEAIDALEAGEQPYLVVDAALGSYFARSYDDIVRVDYISAEDVTPMYALTLTENAELTEAVSTALSTITDNGVLRVVETKWLGAEAASLLPGAVDTSTLPETAFGVWS